MKKRFFSLILVLSLLFLTSVGWVGAEENNETVSSSPAGWYQKLQGRAEEIKTKVKTREENVEQVKEKVQNKLTERVRNRIKSLVGKISNRLQRRIDRLEKHVEHLKEMSAKFAEKGADVSLAEAKISEAETALVGAQDNLAGIEVKLNELLESEDPRSVHPELKSAVSLVREDLQIVRQALTEAVSSLKVAQEGVENE